ncbi:MAG: hypothetical protein KUG65_06760 [Sphingomonadaceae bacterium]|nr:hypothetical protein [Sphingomonadaceae bacterium]
MLGEEQGRGDLFRHNVEQTNFQVALIARVSGCLRDIASLRGGGFSDIQEWFLWEENSIIVNVEVDDQDAHRAADDLYDFHFLVGRRVSDLAENRTGLGTGWHNRSRGWRQGKGSATGTVLGLGTCELPLIIRGDKGGFIQLLEGATGSVQAVDIPDVPLVHSARIIIEQLRRTREEREAIEEEFKRGIAESPPGSGSADWLFAAACLQALERTPTSDSYDILTQDGVEVTGPADAIVLSINSEASNRLRHRRLGFFLDCHNYRINALGPAMLNWLKANFEWVAYSVDDVRRDYIEMTDLLRKDHPERQILVLNAVLTLGKEDVLSYSDFDAPLDRSLASVRVRELNCMLHDIAAETGIAIVDADAIAAKLGVSVCIPDGIHQNGEMQTELRREILSILAARKVPGFARESLTQPQTIQSAL